MFEGIIFMWFFICALVSVISSHCKNHPWYLQVSWVWRWTKTCNVRVEPRYLPETKQSYFPSSGPCFQSSLHLYTNPFIVNVVFCGSFLLPHRCCCFLFFTELWDCNFFPFPKLLSSIKITNKGKWDHIWPAPWVWCTLTFTRATIWLCLVSKTNFTVTPSSF